MKQYRFYWIPMLILALLFTACSPAKPLVEPNESTQPPAVVESKPETQPQSSPAEGESIALSMEIIIGNRNFSATLYDNETARAFQKQLPLTLTMDELNGNEKYHYLSENLPTNSSRPSEIHAGDLMLFGDHCLVLFYESFQTDYSYTTIGRVDDPNGLAMALGNGSVQVTFK